MAITPRVQSRPTPPASKTTLSLLPWWGGYRYEARCRCPCTQGRRLRPSRPSLANNGKIVLACPSQRMILAKHVDPNSKPLHA